MLKCTNLPIFQCSNVQMTAELGWGRHGGQSSAGGHPCSGCHHTRLCPHLCLWQEGAGSSRGLQAAGHRLSPPGCRIFWGLAQRSSRRGEEAGCCLGSSDGARRRGGCEAPLGEARHLAAAWQRGYPLQPCALCPIPSSWWCGVIAFYLYQFGIISPLCLDAFLINISTGHFFATLICLLYPSTFEYMYNALYTWH